METDALRALVKAAATGTPGARIWPNGLGFDCHGTSYSYLEHLKVWTATRGLPGGNARTWGEGATPEAAKRAAGIGRSERRTRGGHPQQEQEKEQP